MHSVIIYVTASLLLANQISASCYYNPPIHGPPGSPPVHGCTLDGQIYAEGATWERTDRPCVECRCREHGAIHCCGVGFRAGVMSFGPGCTVDEFDCYNGEVVDIEEGSCLAAGYQIHLRGSGQ